MDRRGWDRSSRPSERSAQTARHKHLSGLRFAGPEKYGPPGSDAVRMAKGPGETYTARKEPGNRGKPTTRFLVRPFIEVDRW